MLRFIAVILIFGSALGLLSAQSQISNENYTPAYANAMINNVSNYITSVNQSAYLIFSPNLNGAYRNLSYAESNVTRNPSAAVLYAERANTSAYNQYQSIAYYKAESFPVMIVFSLIMLALLYKFMIPVKRSLRSKK